MGGFLPPAQRHSGLTLGLCTCISLLLLMTGERLPTASLRGVGAYLFAPFDRVVMTADRASAPAALAALLQGQPLLEKTDDVRALLDRALQPQDAVTSAAAS